jgi:hypothetical protein
LRRKRESRKPIVLGFTVTVAILFSLFFGLILIRPGIPMYTLPSTIPQYSAIWGNYIPSNVLLFGWENYTAIRQYNSSYPTQYSVLFDILDISVQLRPAAINSVITVSFAQPNESISFAFVDQAAFNNFTTALAPDSSTAVPVGSDSMYYVRNDHLGDIQFGWLAVIPADRGIAFAVGSSDAKQALMECLTVKPSNALISDMNIRRMLYVTNGTEGHLALGVQHFAGVIPAANSTLTVVDHTGSQVEIRRVLEFNDTNIAIQQYSNVKNSYLDAHAFAVYSSYVLATEYEANADLPGAVRLVE